MKKTNKIDAKRKKPTAWVILVAILISVIVIMSFSKTNHERAKSYVVETIEKAKQAKHENDIIALRASLAPKSREVFDFFIENQIKKGDKNLKNAIYHFFNSLDIEAKETFLISYKDEEGNQKQFYLNAIENEDEYLFEIDDSFPF